MADGTVTIKANFDGKDAESGVSRIKSALSGLKESGSRVGSVFKSVLGANLVSSGITTALGMAKNGLVSMVGELSSSTKAWKTFDGNLSNLGLGRDAINQAKSDMQAYATQTVYSASDMASTYAQLAAVGVKDTGSLVKAFGGLAGAAENPAQAMKTLSQQATQMAAKPQVQWADFKLMLEQTPAGIAAVAKEMGMSTSEMVTAVQDGKIATDDFFEALKRAGNSKAFQNMATEFKTVDQAMDGLKEGLANKLMPVFDKVNQFGIKALEAISDKIGEIDFGPIADKIGAFLDGIDLEGLIDKVSTGVGKVKEFFSNFADTGALSSLGTAFQSITDAVGNLFAAISGGKGDWTDLGTSLGNIVKFLADCSTAIGDFIGKMDPGRLQEWGLTIASVAGGFKIFSALTGKSPIASILGKIGAKFGWFGAKAKEGTDKAKSGGGALKTVFSGIGTVIKSLGTGLSTAFKGLGTGISTAAKGIGTGIKTALSGVPAILTALGTAVSTAAQGIGTGLATAFQGLGAAIAIVPPTTWLALGAAILMVGAAFALAGTQADGISKIFKTIGDVVVQILQQVTSSLSTLIPIVASAIALLVPIVASGIATIVTAVAGGISQIILAFATGFSMIISSVAGAIATVIGAFSGLIGAIAGVISAIASVLQSLSSVFSSIFTGIADVITAFGDSVSSILESTGSLFESFGTSVKTALDGVKGVVESLGGAIKAALDGVAGIFDSMGNAAKNAGKGVKMIADAIAKLTGLNAGDMANTLVKVASGLGKIGSNSAGLATAGSGMTQLGAGMQRVGTASTMAVAGLSMFATRMTSLQASITSLPATLMQTSTAFTSFSTQALSALTGLTAISSPITLFKTQVMTLTPALMMAGTSFTTFGSMASMAGTRLMMIAVATTMLSSQLSSVTASLSMTSNGFNMINSVASSLSGVFARVGASATALQSQMLGLGAGVASAIMSAVAAVTAGGAQMSAALRSAGTQMISAMQSCMNQITSAVRNGMNNATSAVRNGGSQMVSAFRSSGQRLVATAQSAVNQAVSAVRAGYGAMVSAGNYIGQGLAVGMNRALGAVRAAADRLVAEANRAAQAKAKINSPSHLFRDEVGWWIGLGIAKGIDNSAPEVANSLDYIRSQVDGFNVKANNLLSGATTNLSSQLKVETLRGKTPKVQRDARQEAYIAHSASLLSDVIDNLAELRDQVAQGQYMMLDTGALVGGTASAYDNAIGTLQTLKGRHKL